MRDVELTKARKWFLILPVWIWALLPWIFWCVYEIHKPGHADPFWLPVMPLVFVSFIPMLLVQRDANPNWFPLGWVIGCSLFNLTVGALLIVTITGLRKS